MEKQTQEEKEKILETILEKVLTAGLAKLVYMGLDGDTAFQFIDAYTTAVVAFTMQAAPVVNDELRELLAKAATDEQG